jgi:hypothetical protein
MGVGEYCVLIFRDDSLEIDRGRPDLTSVPYSEINAIELGGPGMTTTGGGFLGGGFGVEGAVEGMLIASALNMVTTRKKVDTVICLQTGTAEVFFHHDETPPDALRILLSPIFSKLRELHPSVGAVATDRAESPDLVSRLERLADLHAKGVLNGDEFEAAKRKLLQ